MLLAAGCGDDQQGSTTDTASTSTAATVNTATATTLVSPDTSVEVPPEPPPSSGAAAAAPLKIVFYDVDPNTVHTGAPLTCMVTVEGDAAQVIMGLTGPSGSISQTVNLAQGTTVGGVTNWTATVAAPAMPGGWRFGARAIAPDGTEVLPEAGGLSASLLPFEVIP